MKKKKPAFNPKQRAIIQDLNRSRYGKTPYEISKNTGISWVTVKKYVKELQTKKIVTCPKIDGKKVCRLNYDLIYSKKSKKNAR